jgi:hypothetical protein
MPDTNEFLAIFFWVAVAAVTALLGFFVAVAVRRWAQRDERVEAFTFQDLRDMRERGEITPREFQTMRAALLAQYGAADEPEPVEEAGRGGDEGGIPDEK